MDSDSRDTEEEFKSVSFAGRDEEHLLPDSHEGDTNTRLDVAEGGPAEHHRPCHKKTLSQVGLRSRTSTATDLETGKQGGARGQCALLRHESSAPAMQHGERRRKMLAHLLRFRTHEKTGEDLEEEEEEGDDGEMQRSIHGRLMVSERLDRAAAKRGATEAQISNRSIETTQQCRQFTLQAIQPASSTPRLLRWLGLGTGGVSIYEDTQYTTNSCHCCGIAPNRIVINFLHWAFRQSFTTVFLTAACGFFSLTMFFALILWALGKKDPECIGGVDFENDYFTDAFILSWTTFSTVGYGLIYSGISTDVPDVHKCTGVTIVVTWEAFIGVLFASMCGAVLFIKVSRIQSFAQVSFSDCIVIQYGPGVMTGDEEEQNNSSDDETSMDEQSDRIKCPILEFRVVNRLNRIMGGEIIDSSVNVVASIDASQAISLNRAHVNQRRRAKKGKKGGRRLRALPTAMNRNRVDQPSTINENDVEVNPSVGDNGTIFERTSSTESLLSMPGNHLLEDRLPTNDAAMSFEEDPTGHLIHRKVFSKLEMESPDHPFFRRVWMLRHTLNENSPLVRPHARHMIKRNGGFWPRELNSPEGVRAAVQFDQILVSLSGTSNADANSVYAQKVYHYDHLNVGYRFVNMLFRDETDGSLSVDLRLLNDVMEQAGGGGEPLTTDVDDRHVVDMAVL